MEINLELHHYQAEFVDNPSRFRAFISGIGGGKTFIGCFEALRIAMEYQQSVGAIIAPTYQMLSDTTRRTFFEICPQELIHEFHKAENRVILNNGSEIIFRSADEPEKLRGPNLSWFYIDEAAILPTDTTWKIMIGRLRRPPERGWITSTPKGFNWIYDEFIRQPRDNYWWESFSTDQNTFLSQSFIDSLQASYGGSFLRQEFYGEFVSFEGLVYPYFNPMKHILREYPDKLKIKRIEAGIDWGFKNPSVALFIGFDGDNNAYILSEIYEPKLEIEMFIEKVKEMSHKWDVWCGKRTSQFWCDPSEPMFIEKFSRAGFHTDAARNEVVAGISEVSRRLSDPPSLFIHENCINTINELRQYRYAEPKEGKRVKEEPIKVNDHACDALRYALLSQSIYPELALVTHR